MIKYISDFEIIDETMRFLYVLDGVVTSYDCAKDQTNGYLSQSFDTWDEAEIWLIDNIVTV